MLIVHAVEQFQYTCIRFGFIMLHFGTAACGVLAIKIIVQEDSL